VSLVEIAADLEAALGADRDEPASLSGQSKRRPNGRGPQAQEGAEVQITIASTIKPKAVEWVRPGRIARGKLTITAGDPGFGKSLVGVDEVCILSVGGLWPEGGRAPVGKTLLLSGEDVPEDTTVPRAQVMGGDLSKIGFIGQVLTVDGERRRINLATDAALIVAEAVRFGAIGIVIDPLSSYMGSETNTWRDSDVRAVIDTLAEAAGRAGIYIHAIAHLNKGSSPKALYKIGGSIATVASARTAFLVAPDPNDESVRLVACIKSNISVKPPTLSFRIGVKKHPELGVEVPVIEWGAMSPLSADDLVGGDHSKTGAAIERAVEFLSDFLAAGEVESEAIKEAARKAGVGRDSLWRAKDRLGIKARKDGLGAWRWSLPLAESGEEETEV